MSEHTYTTTTVQGYGSRVKNSFVQSIVGIVLFFSAFPMLFANEALSIKEEKKFKAGIESTISLPAPIISAENEGKLVHIIGKARTSSTVSDDIFPISISAINLSRRVYMYQWEEQKSETSKTNTGGSAEVTTTYTYREVWSEDYINSNNFYQTKYQNPIKPIDSYSKYTDELSVGEFSLGHEFIRNFNSFESINNLPNQDINEEFSWHDSYYYRGQDINNPQIGDLRIVFEYIPLQAVSVIGKQQEGKIVPFSNKYGEIIISEEGEFTAKQLFDNELKKNSIRTWVMRFGGFLMMFLGLKMAFSLIGTIISVLPFLEKSFSFISTPVVFLIALVLSVITIAIAWLFYRPIISLILFVGVFFIWRKLKSIKKKKLEEIQTKLAENNEGKLSRVAKIVDNSLNEYVGKAEKTKNTITNILNKF